MTRYRRSKGFTLVELIFVIVILGVISVVVGRILMSALDSFTTSQNISQTDWQGLLTLNNFSNDVHRIRSQNDISTISSGSFSFVDVTGTTVTYSLSGSTLQRNGNALAGGVNSITFAYYDKNYSTTGVAANVRYISLTTSISQNTLTQSYATMAGTRGMP